MSANKLIEKDPWLEPYSYKIQARQSYYQQVLNGLIQKHGSLTGFAGSYLYYGLHYQDGQWVFREWAPNATEIYMVGSFSDWQRNDRFKLERKENGDFIGIFPAEAFSEGQQYKLHVYWDGGFGERLPSHAERVVQDTGSNLFNAEVSLAHRNYGFKHKKPGKIEAPLIYEAHIGMATEDMGVGSFKEFKEKILPRVKNAGYNTIQLMAIQEHPYYGSFGYHVSNFFAASSRFGTPTELKELIDEAHGMGIAVIMDIVHSHSVRNEVEGLGLFDGSPWQYFHDGTRRVHVAWDSLCFNYGKEEVLRLLLSNCRYWLEEYNFDGFRFDGVTSMLYYDHGLSRDFTNYDMYFDNGQDEEAIVYLKLANKLIHEIDPNAITIAEEMSGMPGIGSNADEGGLGFDFRLSMGVPDYWIKIIKELADEQWNMSQIFHELTTRRPEEKTINYAESHDQALVGDKTIFFRLVDQEMYWHMRVDDQSLIIDRGVALHKMIRLITLSTSAGGYLNFMGNEFGHPEWIDFPREGNNWSYKYARRQWSLCDDENLKFKFLNNFDRDIIHFAKEKKYINLSYPQVVHENNKDQIIAYTRGDILFVYNFNPSTSFTDYGISVPAGKYKILFTSDDEQYGGHNRVDKSISYFTVKMGKLATLSPYYLYLYIPNRTVLVLKHTPPAKVR